MSKLKLGPIVDEKPVKITAELPAAVFRNLLAYSEALGRETGQTVEPAQLVAPMIARFMMTDREFVKTRRGRPPMAAAQATPSSSPVPNSETA